MTVLYLFIQFVLNIPGVIKLLTEACRTGDLETLLQAIYCNRDLAQELICREEGDGDESPDCDSPRSFLFMACENGHLDVVRQLIDFGANVNHASYDDLTPLCTACMKGHPTIVRFLISKGALVHDPALGPSSPILLACRSGNHDIIEMLLSEQPTLLRTHGQLLLYDACRLGHVQVVRLLVKKGVDVNPPPFLVTTTDSQGRLAECPLVGACVGQQTGVVNYLIENGAEVTAEIVEKHWELIGEALMR